MRSHYRIVEFKQKMSFVSYMYHSFNNQSTLFLALFDLETTNIFENVDIFLLKHFDKICINL